MPRLDCAGCHYAAWPTLLGLRCLHFVICRGCIGHVRLETIIIIIIMPPKAPPVGQKCHLLLALHLVVTQGKVRAVRKSHLQGPKNGLTVRTTVAPEADDI